MANFCTNCGQRVEQGALFCSACGARLSADAQPAPQPQQTPQWQQPTGEWTPPRTQQAQTPQWQQPSAANEWHRAPGSTGGQWSAPRAAGRAPAERITQAWDAYQNTRQAPAAPAGPGARIGIPAPGYSDRINDPELLAALKKQKRASARLSSFIVPLPLLGFAIYGKVSDKMDFSQALLYGAIISAVFLIFSLIGKKQSSGKNAYEGVVVDKQSRVRRRSSNSGDGNRNDTYYTELITVVRTSTGQEKRIVERDNSRTLAWDYLQIGERFRYHPDHAFPYELYDKSHAPYLRCSICQKKNPVAEDRCQKCGAPLLK